MKNTATVIRGPHKVKGKMYDRACIYLPLQIIGNDQCPIKYGDKVSVNIDPERKCLIIEKLRDKENKQNMEVQMIEKGQGEIKKDRDEPTQDNLEAKRQKWWDIKEIYKYITKAGGLDKSNTLVMYQRNADIFQSHEECKAWLRNKLKTLTDKRGLKEITNYPQHQTQMTQMILCPECKGKNVLVSKTSTGRKCAHCGFNIKKENYEYFNEKKAGR